MVEDNNIKIAYHVGPKVFPLDQVARIPGDVQKMLELKPNSRATHANVLVYADQHGQIQRYEVYYSREDSPGSFHHDLGNEMFSIDDLV